MSLPSSQPSTSSTVHSRDTAAAMQELVEKIVKLVTAAQKLPKLSDNYEFCNSFPLFTQFIHEEEIRVRSLMAKCMERSGCLVNARQVGSSTADYMDRIVRANDVIAERVKICIAALEQDSHPAENVRNQEVEAESGAGPSQDNPDDGEMDTSDASHPAEGVDGIVEDESANANAVDMSREVSDDDDIAACNCAACNPAPRRRTRRRGARPAPAIPPTRLYPFVVSWDNQFNVTLQMSRRRQTVCSFPQMVARHKERAYEIKDFRLHLCHIRRLLVDGDANNFVGSEDVLSCTPARFLEKTAEKREEYKILIKEGLKIEGSEDNLLLERGLRLTEYYFNFMTGLKVFLFNWTNSAVLPYVKLLKANKYTEKAEEYIKNQERKLKQCLCTCTVTCANCEEIEATENQGGARCTLKRLADNGPLRLLPASNKIERRAKYYAISCTGNCGDLDCPNIILRAHLPEDRPVTFAVVRTEDKGFCLITLEDIEPGTIVIEQFGLISHYEELLDEDHSYTYALANGYLLWDTKVEGNLYRFMNHSCLPNLTVIPVYTKGFQAMDLRKRILAVANKHIKAGEELNIDYHPNKHLTARRPNAATLRTDTCRCKSRSCRGWC